MKKLFSSLILFCISFSFKTQLFTPGTGVTDIDGNLYQTIIINGQEWLSENLRTSKYSNGDDIPNITDINLWETLSNGAWVNMLNDSQYEVPYGKLYNWYTVSDSRNVCPNGWRVPSDNDWNTLIQFLDPNQNPLADVVNSTLGVQSSIAGGMLKSTNTQYWINGNFGATNESGFSGLPGGRLESAINNWEPTGNRGLFWSSTNYSQTQSMYAWHRTLVYENADLIRGGRNVHEGLSVRCLKDAASGMYELNSNLKSLIKVTDLMGRETVIKANEVLFYLYNDGSVEKKLIIE